MNLPRKNLTACHIGKGVDLPQGEAKNLPLTNLLI
jgi:hypothetical protein